MQWKGSGLESMKLRQSRALVEAREGEGGCVTAEKHRRDLLLNKTIRDNIATAVRVVVLQCFWARDSPSGAPPWESEPNRNI